MLTDCRLDVPQSCIVRFREYGKKINNSRKLGECIWYIQKKKEMFLNLMIPGKLKLKNFSKLLCIICRGKKDIFFLNVDNICSQTITDISKTSSVNILHI